MEEEYKKVMSNRVRNSKTEGLIDIWDNVLEPHAAELVDQMMREKLLWHYDYSSNKSGVNKHWHILCGRQLIFPEYDFLAPIWEVAREKYDFENRYDIVEFKRVYCNSHTFGVEPHMHTDDGDLTMMYYPILDWEPEWLGGTAIWNDAGNEIDKYVNYIGNRLLVFDAKLNHQAMPVSRQCYRLRSVVVFKTWKRGFENAAGDRLDFYGKD